MTVSLFAAGVCLSAGGVHALSIGLAVRRCAWRGGHMPPPKDAPPVSIVQPLCGVETFSRETLRSIFALDYPDYEVLFCLASADDPIAPLVRGAIAAHPDRRARLLVGDDRVSANPKLNNVVKGFGAARSEWVIMADSNVLMPPDYIQRLLARWRPNSGIVCSPPIGTRPESFGAEVECGFLNTYEARWQYAAEAVGLGFAQGKTMLWRRDILEAGGGIEALGAEIAEDAASTKLIHRQGFDAHLVSEPFQQPLGARKLKDVWGRQLRWARLRRVTFPFQFAPEIITTSLVVIVAAGVRGAGVRDEPRGERRPRCALLVRAGGPARLGRGLAAELAEPACLDHARLSFAPALGRRLAGRPFRLARQRHERRRIRLAASPVRNAPANVTAACRRRQPEIFPNRVGTEAAASLPL